MRENEFEKRVQDKMGELKLVPSAEVWDSVERRIRKEKKRRFLIWWPLALLLAGGAITAGILLGGNKKEKVPVTVQNNTVNEKNPGPGITIENTSTPNENVAKDEPLKETKDTKEAEEKNNTTNTNVPVVTIPENKTGQDPAKPSREPKKTDTRLVTGKKKKQPSLPVIITETKPPVAIKEPVETQPVAKEEIRKENPIVVQNETREKPKEPVNEIPVKVPVTTEPMVSKTETPAPKEPVAAVTEMPDSNATVAENKKGPVRKNNTRWGLSVSYGRSNITEGPGFFAKNERLADASGLQTGSPNQLASYGRNNYEPAKAWTAGFWVRTQLSPRVFGEGELGYMHLSNKMAVGSRVDSARLVNNTYSQGVSVSSFYRPSTGQTFTNQYHFLRLSGSISWQFLNSKKFRPEWINGLEYNRLVGSNMLHWDWNLPGYYKDNKLLTKNHLFYHTGLSIPAGNRVRIDPFTSFSLTRVLRNNDSLRTNFSQWGIRLKIDLSKK